MLFLRFFFVLLSFSCFFLNFLFLRFCPALLRFLGNNSEPMIINIIPDGAWGGPRGPADFNKNADNISVATLLVFSPRMCFGDLGECFGGALGRSSGGLRWACKIPDRKKKSLSIPSVRPRGGRGVSPSPPLKTKTF